MNCDNQSYPVNADDLEGISPPVATAAAERILRAARATTDGWWEWDLASNSAWYSPEFAQLLGFEIDDLLPQSSTWADLVHPGDLDAVLRAIDEHLVGGPSFDVQFRMRTREGEWRWFRARGRCTYDAQQRPHLVSGNLQDIHSHKLVAHQGNSARQRLVEQQRMDSLNTMAGGVAHEFNNLLQVMQGYVQCALRMAQQGGDVTGDLRQAQGAIDRAIKLNREFLSFCRTGEFEATTVDLNATLTALAERLRPILPPAISLVAHGCGEPLLVTVHEAGLHEALLNLGTNARDAMPQGGELTVRCYPLEVDKRNAQLFPSLPCGSYACLAVTDTGEGIEPERAHRVWEPFYTTKAPNRGSGLGLAQVYGFANNHRGAVGLHSRPQQGTTFRIYLPLVSRSQTTSTEVAAVPHSFECPLLLYTGDPLLTDTLKRTVAPYGGSLMSVDCPELLMRELAPGGSHYEYVLLDCDAPSPVAEQIANLRPELRIICFTGFESFSSLPPPGGLRGVGGIIEKPLDGDWLLECLGKFAESIPPPAALTAV